jgi:hypothetical protein
VRILFALIAAAVVMWITLIVYTRLLVSLPPPGVTTARSLRLASFARQVGWDFVPRSQDVVALCSNLPVAPVHSASRRSLAENVLHGPFDGWNLLVFEHVTWDGAAPRVNGDSTGPPSGTRTRHTVWALPLPARLPWVQVTPRGMHGRRLGDKVATGDRAFDQALSVRTDAPDFALSILTPAVRKLLLDAGTVGWRIDEQHRYLLCWAEGHLADPADLVRQARNLILLHTLLPHRHHPSQLPRSREAGPRLDAG